MEPRDLEHLAEEIRQLRSSVDELSQLLRMVFNIKSAAGPTPAKRKKKPTRKQQATRKIEEDESRDSPPPPGKHF
ncbi:hypothetical protein [Rhodopirellula europaea]|uniref:Uncharacterized protein n=1 Tax=Rhodopirellula europaea SH398 TaxID=1263868 RepID=M5RXI8_9BACT|nr:hypothetical protein [Rhodopirellula europaea]EMI24068.1 hypothetical protein RESH_05390 [Rhodopirellula europaea SH398]